MRARASSSAGTCSACGRKSCSLRSTRTPRFSAISISFSSTEGFELLNLDYTGAGNKTGRFTKPGRFGKLLSSDAVWVVSDDRLFAAEGDRLGGDVIRLALFMLLNGATDLAIDLLLRAKERRGVSYERYRDAPLFAALNKQTLLLFKDLLALPMLSSADVLGTYKSIFGRDFPSLNRFYEDPMFT